jgi:hypothetical protein
MSQTRLLFSLLFALAVGCGQVDESPDGAPAGSDHRSDGGDQPDDDVSDAASPTSAIDGAPAECNEANQGEPCGDGVLACGAFSSCGGFADACDESGTQSRSCTDSTCQAGVCVKGDAYTDSRSCQRDTDGATCAASTTSCAACAYDNSGCDNTAPDVSCTRTDHTCANGSCGSSVVSAPNQSCDRNTECRSCRTIPGDQPGSCSANGTCGAICH